MTTVAYTPLTTAENAFKTVIWTPLIRAGELYLEGLAPFLALPVVKQLDELIVNQLTDALFEFLRLQVDLAAIKLVNEHRQAVWSHASERLGILANELGDHSLEYQKALTDEANAFALFVHRGP